MTVDKITKLLNLEVIYLLNYVSTQHKYIVPYYSALLISKINTNKVKENLMSNWKRVCWVYELDFVDRISAFCLSSSSFFSK